MSDIGTQVKHFFRHRRRTAIALVCGVAVIVVLIALVISGRYPVMVVNGTLISSARFAKNYASAAILHSNQLKINAENPAALDALKRVTPAELGASVLDTLVEATLVERGAKREVGNQLPGLVHAKIDEYANDPELQRGVQTLYGMGYADFRDETLVPVAEHDILEGRLYLRGQSYEQ
ncbi:MAG: hypothetical protein RL681_390, partial [Candidatus Parcubacteria bacterium]